MKRSAKPLYPQMNLPLFNVPATATPDEQPKELTIALMELLISAAEEKKSNQETEERMNSKLTPERILRKAVVYVRQSKPSQLIHNQESTRLQFSLAHRARTLGFQRIIVIDDDQGRTGSGLVDRPGFQRLAAEVSSGEVGAVFCVEASRLARNRLHRPCPEVARLPVVGPPAASTVPTTPRYPRLDFDATATVVDDVV